MSVEEELFEDAPCGFLTTRPDGTIVRVNRTFETWTGHSRDALVGTRRFQELLTPGGQIYHDTHYAPLLQMQGSVGEIAVEIVRADGSRLPALINSVQRGELISTTVFDATDRRRYEEELVRARRREQEIAQRLQRSMLSGELPHTEGVDVDVVYRPADHGLEVGGDWYDAFWVRDSETLVLVVGDVVGRGIEAAATMGQLRSAVRALASTGLRPGGVLDALDRYARSHGVGRGTTLVYAELDLVAGALCYAVAGHPPPLVVVRGEEPTFLWDGRSVPLDAYPDARPGRGEALTTMLDDTLLVLYTDGLVERRSRGVLEGMERLREMVPRDFDVPVAQISRGLVDGLDDPGNDDDVCLLAARVKHGPRPPERPRATTLRHERAGLRSEGDVSGPTGCGSSASWSPRTSSGSCPA